MQLCGHAEVAKALLAKGANREARNKKGKTALELAEVHTVNLPICPAAAAAAANFPSPPPPPPPPAAAAAAVAAAFPPSPPPLLLSHHPAAAVTALVLTSWLVCLSQGGKQPSHAEIAKMFMGTAAASPATAAAADQAFFA